jgi:Uma2 family endonuclease
MAVMANGASGPLNERPATGRGGASSLVGVRHETLDGTLLTTPAPVARHQMAITGLLYALRAVCPAELTVVGAPLEYRPDERTSVQPDLVIVRSSDIHLDGPLTATPLVVVEILSHGARDKDRAAKRGLYQRQRVPAYWVFDPTVPSLGLFDLIDGNYAAAATVAGGDELTIDWPYPLRLCPEELAVG